MTDPTFVWSQPNRRSGQYSTIRGRRRIAQAVLVAASVVAVARFFVRMYTEQMWFGSVGASSTWVRQTLIERGLSFGAFLLTFAVAWANLLIANRMGTAVTVGPSGSLSNDAVGQLAMLVGFAGRWPRVAVAAVVSLVVSPIVGSRWEELTLLLFRSPHSTSPIRVLGQRADVSVFVIPFFVSIIAWLITLLIVCGAINLVSYALSGAIRRVDNRFLITEEANTHLSALLALFCLAVGMAMWLTRFGLAVGQRGPFVGLMYTDRMVRVPAYSLLAMAAAIVAGAALSNARSKRWSIPAVGMICWSLVAFITLEIVPRVSTANRSGELVSAGLDDHIEATLFAYDLDGVRLSASIGAAGISRLSKVSEVVDRVVQRVDSQSTINNEGTPLFGRSSDGYSISKPTEKPARTGIDLSGVANRIAFGLRFGDVGLIRGAKRTKGSQLIFRRNVVERARAIAPFLRFDSDPYPVVANKRKLWIIDAYSTSNRFPGAQRHDLTASDLSRGTELGEGFNYIRNSVRVVVDASEGTTRLYRTDLGDQIIATWARAFPKLFRSANSLERDYPGIGDKFRYPSDLLAIQASVFGSYRHSSSATLRDGTRRWMPSAEGPVDRTYTDDRRIRVAPMYRLVKIPGERTARNTITQTLETTPGAEPARLSAMLSGRTNQNGVNTLTFTPIVGRLATPSDVGELMLDDPAVVSGLSKYEARTMFGPVQVIPVEGDLLVYVRPVYLRPTNTVTRVIVYDGTHVVMAKTVNEALENSVTIVGTAEEEVALAARFWDLAKQEFLRSGDSVKYRKSIEAILDRLSTVPKDTQAVR